MKHTFSKNLIALALSFCISYTVTAMERESGKKVSKQENPLTLSQDLGTISVPRTLEQLTEDLKSKMNLIDDVSLPYYSNILHLTAKEPLCIGRESLDKIKNNKNLNPDKKLKYEQQISAGILDAINKATVIIDNFQIQMSSLDPKLPEADRYWQETYYRQESLKNAEKYLASINLIFLESRNLNIQINDQVLDQSYALSNKFFLHNLEYIMSLSSYLNNRIAHLNLTQVFASHFKEGATRLQKEPVKPYTEQFQNIRQLLTSASQAAEKYLAEIKTETKKVTK